MDLSTFVSPLSSLAGVVVGAWLLNHFTIRRNRKDDLAEMRLRAYVDFITVASKFFVARRLGQKEDEVTALAVLNDAKTRICICGQAEVVQALKEFWMSGGTLEKESEILAFNRLCNQMRKSLGERSLLGEVPSLSDMLFKLEPSSYSYKVDK